MSYNTFLQLKELIDQRNFDEIRKMLSDNPDLANEGLPCDEVTTTKAHPLHRICDGVFANLYTDEEGVEIAKMFLEHGASVNGYELVEKQDTPLTAAASLHAEKVGMLYIAHGANIHHGGCHGGTALHWAAWTGRDKLLQKLIHEGAEINRRCIDFQGTPLLWAVHGYTSGGVKNRYHQIECVKILLAAGADKEMRNIEGVPAIEFLDKEDEELRTLLQ